MSATTPAQELLLHALQTLIDSHERHHPITASALRQAKAEIEGLRDARAAAIEELEKEARECADQLQLLAKDQTKINPFSRAVYDKLDALRALANRSALPR